jgi:uncharacterized protein involved in type VI secretion and phage assembly
MPNEDVERLVEAMSGRHFGKYRGLVVSNTDPERRGRLEVRVPSALGDQSVWALPCVPYAGDGVGLFAMPKAGAAVWVEFEQGDINYPIWVGCFWTDGQIPASDSSPDVKFWKTDKLTIRIDDAEGSLTIENTTGSTLKLTSQDVTIEATTVAQKSGVKKTNLSAASFDVNDGAFTVM